MKQRLCALALCLALMLAGTALATPEENTMPIGDGSMTLSVYTKLGNGVEQLISNYNESPTIQELSRRTGVTFEFIHPPVGDDGTFFNMLIASNDFPDIFVAADEFAAYPGGADGAIEDGIIINPNELIEQYADHFIARMATLSDEEVQKMKTDMGVWKLTEIGSNVVDGKQHTGLVMRKDWLDELGLEVPRTIEEFEAVLRAFRDEKGATVPLAIAGLNSFFLVNGNQFSSAYGLAFNNFMLDEEGRVTHGYLQPGYKDMLSMLTRWMAEGLIDVDSINRADADCQKMTYSGQSGVCSVGNWSTREMLQLGQAENPAYDLVGVSILRLSDADEQMGLSSVMHRISGTAGKFYISATCSDPVSAIKLIDYLYSEECNLLTTWGVGELADGNWTYEVADGVRRYSDYLQHNDIPFSTLRNLHYIHPLTTQTLDEMELSQYNAPINQQCWEAWSHNVDDSRLFPTAASNTAEESRIIADAMTEIDTYAMEAIYRIVCGDEPVEAWDGYVAKLSDLGIARAIECKQAALDRYSAR